MLFTLISMMYVFQLGISLIFLVEGVFKTKNEFLKSFIPIYPILIFLKKHYDKLK